MNDTSLLILDTCGDIDMYDIPYHAANHPHAIKIIQTYNSLNFKRDDRNNIKDKDEEKRIENEIDEATDNLMKLIESWKSLKYMDTPYGAYGMFHIGNVIYICLT